MTLSGIFRSEHEKFAVLVLLSMNLLIKVAGEQSAIPFFTLQKVYSRQSNLIRP